MEGPQEKHISVYPVTLLLFAVLGESPDCSGRLHKEKRIPGEVPPVFVWSELERFELHATTLEVPINLNTFGCPRWRGLWGAHESSSTQTSFAGDLEQSEDTAITAWAMNLKQEDAHGSICLSRCHVVPS